MRYAVEKEETGRKNGDEGGLGRKRHKNETIGSQTGDYAIFQMPRHALYVIDL